MYREHSSHWSMKLCVYQFTTLRSSSTIIMCNYLSKILEKNLVGEWSLVDFLSVSRLHCEFFWPHLTMLFTFEWSSNFRDNISTVSVNAFIPFNLIYLIMLLRKTSFKCMLSSKMQQRYISFTNTDWTVM